VTGLRIADDLVLPLDAVTQTFAILAIRGSGKTYTAAVMVEEMVKAALPVAVIDPIGVWWGLRADAAGTGPGLPVVVFGGDHGDLPLDANSGEAIADAIVELRPPAVIDLSLLRKGEQQRFVTAFAERLYHRNRAPLHLVLDEADAWALRRPVKGTDRLLGAIEDLVRRGRARGLGVTLITQRPAVLHKDVLTQVQVLIALRMVAPHDREAIDAWVRVHGTPEQREELMASLPSLPVGNAWFWSPGWLDLFQRVAIRRRETFDSSATPKMGEERRAPQALATVDLESLREKIAETIERVESDDPKVLRQRIAELERELRAWAASEGQRIFRVTARR
jgi:DNA helicase HerA-like ATPase